MVFFASNLHMEMGEIIGKSISSEHFGILQFWEFFCQPFGENTFSKNVPKRVGGSLFFKRDSDFLNDYRFIQEGFAQTAALKG